MNVESELAANPRFREGHENAMRSSQDNMYICRVETGRPSIYVASCFNCQQTACLQECNNLIYSSHVLNRTIITLYTLHETSSLTLQFHRSFNDAAKV